MKSNLEGKQVRKKRNRNLKIRKVNPKSKVAFCTLLLHEWDLW